MLWIHGLVLLTGYTLILFVDESIVLIPVILTAVYTSLLVYTGRFDRDY